MPFGSQSEAGGGVRFRLWAPSAQAVALCLKEHVLAGTVELPMTGTADGWFELFVAEAAAGSRYRFRIDDGQRVPDPASRCNPDDIFAASEVIDSAAYNWPDDGWRGRPWHEAVIYELHVGCFTPAGTFAGVIDKLDYLVQLGVTAIELMPVADFPGRRNWGYDGVLPFAPDSSYGRPEDLKRLVQAAHQRGLMVLLDVVYNHLGPEGNYLPGYAAAFFDPGHQTPWGPAINFASRPVRDFFIHNALCWLEEYQLDGLRLDAVHAIEDDSRPDIVVELADAIHRGPGRDRRVHLVLENDRNQARYLARDADGAALHATAQWNDDLHHALHVLLTGENAGYYADYAAEPLRYLGRSLAEGFSFQGQPSPWRQQLPRGDASAHLPPTAFISFLQNHDQIGNRAFGERLCQLVGADALAAAIAIVLLAPAPPLLFMGEEFAAAQPFLYFCDFQLLNPELASAVSVGRRREFGESALQKLPEPNDELTYRASQLDWGAVSAAGHAGWLALYRQLLALRRTWITPRLPGMAGGGQFEIGDDGLLTVTWQLGDGSRLTLLANPAPNSVGPRPTPAGTVIYQSPALSSANFIAGDFPPWSVAWLLAETPP